MTEATQELVKTYLELCGYLVATDYTVKLGKNKRKELDIIAFRINKKNNIKLPKYFVGEVKSYGINWHFIPELAKNANIRSSRSKAIIKNKMKQYYWLTDKPLLNKMLKKIKKEFGHTFKFVCFVRGERNIKYKSRIEEHLKKMNVEKYYHEELFPNLIKLTNTNQYKNNPLFQAFRLLNKTVIRKEAKDLKQIQNEKEK